MKKLLLLIPALLIAGIYFYGCQESVLEPTPDAENYRLNATASNPDEFDLYAGQNILVGKVQVWNDTDNLYVRFVITEPSWCLGETHVAVGTDPSDIPQKNGNPIPGKFPYKHDEPYSCTEDLYTIPLSDFEVDVCNSDIIIAAHAVAKDNSCELNGVVYGMAVDASGNATGQIWEVDIVNQLASNVFTSTLADLDNNSTPNGLAYDGENNRVYYCNYKTSDPKYLFFWDGTDEFNAGELLLEGTTAAAQNAAADFYNGSYYYILSLPASDDLYQVTFYENGYIDTQTKLADISGDAHKWEFFGDIAIKDGILYGWGLCKTHNKYEFFTYDLDEGIFDFVETVYTNSLQLAFGTNGILYGHDYYSGAFRTIDLATGAVSEVISVSPSVRYTDCASGMLCIPESDETAWGGEGEFGGANWARYITYTVECCDEWIVYGSYQGTNDKIYKVDLKTTPITITEFYDPGNIDSHEKFPNGNAYDPINQRIYFATKDGRLFYYDIDDMVQTEVGAGFSTTDIASGAWYDGAYYFVPDNSNKLYKIENGVKTFIHDVPASSYYGDIVINSAGLLIGSGFGTVWYTYNLTTPQVAPINLTKTGDGGTGGAWQLAYASNGELYAHAATSGEWFQVTITGTTVDLNSIGTTLITLTDLASGPQCQ